MGKVVKKIIGAVTGSDKAEKRQRREMDRQRAELSAERSRLRQVEEGQKRARRADRSFLAFIDDELSDTLG